MTAGDRLRQLDTAATPPPWVVMRTGVISEAEEFAGEDNDDGSEYSFGACTVIDDDVEHPEDAALIVALRNAAPLFADFLDAADTFKRLRGSLGVCDAYDESGLAAAVAAVTAHLDKEND